MKSLSRYPRIPVLFSLLVLTLHLSPGHAARPQRFHQASEPIRGLFGSEIGDVVWSGRYLWVGTESGVARLDPAQSSGLNASDWITFTELNGLGRGAISALDAIGDTVWVATLIDTLAAGQTFQAGTGLSFSHDGGLSWNHIPNEAIFDTTKAGFERSPGTIILNGCFDIALDGETVYAAFLAGSTVRSRDQGRTWEPFLPGGADRLVFFATDTAADSLRILADSLSRENADTALIAELRAGADSLASQEFLHRTFAVVAHGDTVWIGTSSGIAFTMDGGQTWKNAKVRLDADGNPLPGHPAGNWVVALERLVLPDGSTSIWAGTNTTPAPEGQTQAISVSRDLGQTWAHTGPTFAWDFAFTPNFAWAGTGQGLLASRDPALTLDAGRDWSAIEIIDGQPLTGTFVGLERVGDVLWAGAEKGLGRSEDEGSTWRVIRDLIRTRSLDTGAFVSPGGVPDSTALTYGAPNPFAPSRETATIVFSLEREAQVSIAIYDFASRLVRDLISAETFAGGADHRIAWDGRDTDGQSVANGTYFYRIELNTGRQVFGKVVVLD